VSHSPILDPRAALALEGEAEVTDANLWATLDNPYEQLAAQFEIRCPEHFNMADDTVGRHARGARADHVALVCAAGEEGDGHSYSYRELDLEARRFAALLRRLGVRRGEVVVCYTPQGRVAALTHLAAYLLGAVVAPLSLLYGRDTLRHAIRDSRAKWLVTTRRAWDALPGLRDELPELEQVLVAAGARAGEIPFERYSDEAPIAAGEPTRATDPALLLYTSGSTGLPKGILHAHRLVLGYLASVSLFYELQMREPGQVLWTPSDWSWVAGIVNVQMTGWYFGQTVVAGQGKVTPEWIFDFVATHGVTHTFLTPTALKRMAAFEQPLQRWPGVRLRAIGTGGEPCPSTVLEWSRRELGIPVNEFYGLTEVNHLVGNCERLFPVRPGLMGKAYPGHHLRILDDNGQPVPAGTVGQIAARRDDPTLFIAYWGQPERTASMFLGDWVLTGDYARVDEEGYFWYEGRRDDLIKSAGYRIGPAEVEDCLVSHPAVEEAAVVGVPDADRGQVVMAYVRLRQGQTGSQELADELRSHVKRNLALYKYPRLIEFVDAFPLTSTGKISRKDLRAAALSAGRAGTP
jgi:acetyl-CoA synthetase